MESEIRNHNSNILLSIIVPVYNAEKTLHRCLTSILHQTFENIQIILVDDGSTDSSLKICEEFQALDHRVEVYAQSNKGPSAARNFALQFAKGDYIGFVDSDDWIEKEMYGELISFAQTENADIVSEPCIFHYSETAHPYQNSNDTRILSRDDAREEMLFGKGFSGHMWNKLFKRDILPQKLFNEDVFLYEDILAIWNILNNCNRILCIDIHRYHYVINPNSLMHEKYNPNHQTGKVVADVLLTNSRNMNSRIILGAQLFNVKVHFSILNRMCNSQVDKGIRKAEYLELKQTIRNVRLKDINQIGGLFDKIEAIFARYSYLLYVIVHKLRVYLGLIKKRLR